MSKAATVDAAQRIVSLQPSVTLMLAGMGAAPRLVACTKYCADVCAEVRESKLAIVQDSWTAQAEEITALEPDLVIAAVPYQMESLAQLLKAGARVLCLAPKCLADIYADMALLGALLNRRAEAQAMISKLQQEIEAVRAAYANRPRQKVYCEEWGKPLIHSQRWVAELIEAAGGEMFGAPGTQTTAEFVREADPDVILAAWCGAGDRVPLEKIVPDRNWNELRAARERRVFCIADELLNTPAQCLVGGLKAIAWALHPEGEKPSGIRQINGAAR